MPDAVRENRGLQSYAGVSIAMLTMCTLRLSLQCSSPGGCGTHFCYKCGQVIVRSASAHETQEAVQAHYSRCTMLEVD
jgi:hypothetical protein